MPFAKINGLELNYELHGETGPPLVLVHGYTGDITDWRHQLPAFAPSFRVLVFDLRGHGASAATPDRDQYSIGHFADEVEGVIDEFGFERYHLLGHSMGGAVVQEIALRSPGRLLSLILHDTTDDFASAAANPALKLWRDYRFKVAEEQGMEAVAKLSSPFPPPPHMPADRMEETALRLARMPVDSFIGAWQGLESWAGTRDRAAQIKTPALVLWGDIDSGFLIEGSKRLAQAIEGAETAIIPQTAHQPQWERPELYNAALGAFLNRVAGER